MTRWEVWHRFWTIIYYCRACIDFQAWISLCERHNW